MKFTSLGNFVWQPATQPVYPLDIMVNTGQIIDRTDAGSTEVEIIGAQEVVQYRLHFNNLQSADFQGLLSFLRNIVNWSAQSFYFFDGTASILVRYAEGTFQYQYTFVDTYSVDVTLEESI